MGNYIWRRKKKFETKEMLQLKVLLLIIEMDAIDVKFHFYCAGRLSEHIGNLASFLDFNVQNFNIRLLF